MTSPRAHSEMMLQPDGWLPPRGYSHGVVATGRYVVLAGQIGWNPTTGLFESDDFVAQVRQALRNVVAILAEAGASAQDLVRLTWFITQRSEYLGAQRAIGAAYREVIGNYYPPMSVVVVSALIEEQAKVEIEATAVIP